MKPSLRKLLAVAFATLGLGVFLSLGFFAALSKASTTGEPVAEQKIQLPAETIVQNLDPALAHHPDGATIEPWWHSHIHTEDAWAISRGEHHVIVAVIDTGADIHHPDLAQNIWNNPGETGIDDQGHDRSHNGIDDDSNGFIDDVHGWDFVSDSNDLTDHHGHGTHIAGIIGSTGATHSELVGIAPRAQLMILKYYDPRAVRPNPLASTIKAIRYAVAMGADVINYSGGGTSPSADEKSALQYAADHGVLVVAAAGNEHSDSDLHPYFPADYDLPNLLSVTAMNEAKDILPSSNFGHHSVGIAAPGEGIISTLPGGAVGPMTGTSQATAFVSGTAALLLATRPDLRNPERMIRHLLATGAYTSKHQGKTRSGSTLDVYRHLSMESSETSASGETLDEASLTQSDTNGASN